MKSLSAVTLTILALTATAASADRIDARRDYQLRQIEAGRDSGALTWREGRKLRRQQAAIARTEYQMRADGHLSRSERETLRDMQHARTSASLTRSMTAGAVPGGSGVSAIEPA